MQFHFLYRRMNNAQKTSFCLKIVKKSFKSLMFYKVISNFSHFGNNIYSKIYFSGVTKKKKKNARFFCVCLEKDQVTDVLTSGVCGSSSSSCCSTASDGGAHWAQRTLRYQRCSCGCSNPSLITATSRCRLPGPDRVREGGAGRQRRQKNHRREAMAESNPLRGFPRLRRAAVS